VRLRNHMTLAIAATFGMIVSAGTAAMARGFSGDWPITVSHSQRSNGSYCAMLTDDGSGGWPHSGSAFLVNASGRLFGTFQVIDKTIMLTFEVQGGEGGNAGLVFIAPTGKDAIGKGVYEEVYGGEESDSGVAMFGAKGGC
jgi:hypothetical protein